MRRHTGAVAAALIACSQLSAQTDSAATWPIGSRVRVWTAPNRNVVGQLIELRGDTLMIDTPGVFFRPETKILASSATRLEVSDGRRVSPQRVAGGALGGAALGVATLAVLDAAFSDFCPLGECEESSPNYGRAAFIGAAAGAIAGAISLGDRWRELRMPGRVTLAPGARRTAIGMSFAFR